MLVRTIFFLSPGIYHSERKYEDRQMLTFIHARAAAAFRPRVDFFRLWI